MISVLIAESLSVKTIDRLNEIPEFDVSEAVGLDRDNFERALQSVDALVVSGSSPIPASALANAANLKLIVVSGRKTDRLDSALAGRRKGIEVRFAPPAPAGGEGEDLDVIAILKDFFNV